MTWDDLADDLALVWWLSDRQAAQEKAAREEGVRVEAERANRDASERAVTLRRAVAFAAAPTAARRWEEFVAATGIADQAGQTISEEVAVLLVALGFSPRAAAAALGHVGWRGSPEATLLAALLNQPLRRPDGQ